MIDDLSNALLFAGALLLGLALIFSVFLPRVVFHLRPRRRRHIDPGFWYGHGFDTSGITPKLQEVRQDYVAEVKARGHVTEYGATLLASACEAVRKLAFFRDRTSNEQQ